MLKLSWDGSYLDGRSAAKIPVSVRLTETGVIISKPGEEILWPYAEIRQVQGHYEGEPVRLERGGKIPEILILSDPDFLAHLHRLKPKAAGRFHNPETRRARLRYTVYAAFVVVIVLGPAYFRGIPWAAAFIAHRVPLEWERGLGQSVLQILAPEETRCNDPALARAVEGIVRRLEECRNIPKYRFKIIVVENAMVNAAALPGGHIIVFRGLLKKTRSPEELAGVLAHEMQHVIRRHATKRLIEESSTSLILAAVTGDVTGAAAYGMKAAHSLAMMSYSRADEEEADREGMRMMLEAGVDPKGMIDFFEVLKEPRPITGPVKYLSTHPDMNERIQKIKRIAADNPGSAKQLIAVAQGDKWSRLKESCRAKP